MLVSGIAQSDQNLALSRLAKMRKKYKKKYEKKVKEKKIGKKSFLSPNLPIQGSARSFLELQTQTPNQGLARFFLRTPNLRNQCSAHSFLRTLNLRNQGSALSFLRTPNLPNQGSAHSLSWNSEPGFGLFLSPNSELRTRVRPGPFSELPTGTLNSG